MKEEHMAQVISERMTARMEGDFVVFLIGMRINQWWKPQAWLPVARAMGPMLRELYSKPELGLLGHEFFFGRTVLVVQYWRSLEQLMAYARDRNGQHLPAWRDFNQRAKGTSSVGIWHETYAVRPGGFESIYVGMPRFGLGKVGELVPAVGHMNQARDRLKGTA
jgi:hypothetical protein